MERKQNDNQNQNQNQNEQRFSHNSSSSSSSNYRGLPRSSTQQFQREWISRNDPDRNSSNRDNIITRADQVNNSVRNRMLNSVASRGNVISRRDLLNPEQNRRLYDEIQEIIAARFQNPMPNVRIREYLIEQRDHVSKWAMTSGGCDYLKGLLAPEYGGELRETILAIVAADLPNLMVHDIGIVFVRALFLSCDEHQMNTVLQSVLVGKERVFVDICNDYYGSKMVNVLIDNLKTETQLAIITNVLEARISYFTNYIHGQNVLAFFIYTRNHNFSKMRLFNAMANNCLVIAMNELGSRVLRCSICQMFFNDGLISSLLNAIVANVFVLSNDIYGNCLIQYVIDENIEGVTKGIVGELMGRFCDLANSQFGSNVVKKCLEKCEQRELVMIVEEFTNSSELPCIAKDYFGNDVLQCALEQVFTPGTKQHYCDLVKGINLKVSNIQEDIIGSRVIEKIKQLNQYSLIFSQKVHKP